MHHPMVRAGSILGRPEDEAIDGLFPVEGPVPVELAARAGYRPDPALDYFLTERCNR